MKHLKFLKKTIVGILFIFTLSSCDKNEILIQSDSNLEYLKCNAVNQYEISEEEALADLSKFLNDESTNDSRASDNRIVRAISSVSLSDYFGNESRNSMGDVDCDKPIYIADFENNQGYAVLAADRRISKPIIGIIDSVAPDPNKPRIEPKPVALRDWDWDILGLTRPVYDGYPTDGPGFFTDPKYQNEVFINPNTVNLYDDDAKDTLVGTYFFDEDEISRAEKQ
ncbi:Spi family protease inhibitor [Muribaculum intestinale]|uniref:Spi family protease inhibitor n=1 Tax=Muribaculum intestinale TaxID=1796646 RepID=UPI0025B796A7|nr:Spi family protease inhibitor [Muribaculum intestinale]